VDAVELPDRHDAGTGRARQVTETVPDLHPISLVSFGRGSSYGEGNTT
jgi:hypothetical protein